MASREEELVYRRKIARYATEWAGFQAEALRTHKAAMADKLIYDVEAVQAELDKWAAMTPEQMDIIMTGILQVLVNMPSVCSSLQAMAEFLADSRTKGDTSLKDLPTPPQTM